MPKSFFEENKKIIYFIVGLMLIFIAITLLQPFFMKLIEKDPDASSTYHFVVGQIGDNSMLWLFVVSFISSLFFIIFPSDFIFSYYIIAGANPFLTLINYFLGVMLGRIVDYWIGFLFSDFVTKKIIKQDYNDFNEKFSKWGISVLFFGNLIPFFPIEFFVTFVGTLKFSFWKTFWYSVSGKILKLILLIVFFKYLILYNTQILNFNFFGLVQSAMKMLLP